MFYMLALKIEQSKGGCQLVGDEWVKLPPLLYPLDSSTHLRHQLCNLLLTDEPPIDTHALTEGMEIGLRIETGTQASLAQGSFNKCCRRAFAFRASNQCARIAELGVTKRFEEPRFAC